MTDSNDSADDTGIAAEGFPVGWWVVYPGTVKLDLADKDKIMACFAVKKHAIEYGARMWPGFFAVKQVVDSEIYT